MVFPFCIGLFVCIFIDHMCTLTKANREDGRLSSMVSSKSASCVLSVDHQKEAPAAFINNWRKATSVDGLMVRM